MRMKILLGYSYYPYFYDVKEWVEAWVARLNKAGFEIDAVPLTINPPAPPCWWDMLDKKWKLGDRQLLTFYENLARKLENYDVFLNWNGINIHPEILKYFPSFNVYSCFDDPDSSERLSRPVAKYYDLCLVGNIAEVKTYTGWGVKESRFWPLGFMSTDYDPELKEEDFYKKNRNIDLSLLCERKYIPDRIKRLDTYSKAFPTGMFYGNGWDRGLYPENKKVELYQGTKIGPNFHNSTGPVNFRTYTLPANGVMQICDNKEQLGKIFELDKEVVGFDTVEEAIELTKYYLAHQDERIRIAMAGWKRAIKDYNEVAVFSLAEKYINEIRIQKKERSDIEKRIVLQRRKTFLKRMMYYIRLKLSGKNESARIG
jgi:spore maturation protein CgeB